MTDGQRSSFDITYKALFPVVFRVAYRVTGDSGLAEDLSHEAFIKYFERTKPLPDLDQTKYWLIRVVKNISLNYEKKKSRERVAYEKLKRVSPKFSEPGDTELLRKEAKSAVQIGLSLLPYQLRIVLVLKEYANLNYKEIGSILGIREGNVKVRVFRAREKLAKILEERTAYVP